MKYSIRFAFLSAGASLGSDLIGRGAKQIEQSSEAVRQQKAIEKKLGLNPESRD